MRVVIQRVTKSTVSIDNKVVGKIGTGMLILLGISVNDTEKDLHYLVDKCANLRIFEDSENKMNLSLRDVKGEALIVSQFTLYGNCSKGRRPGFTDAARPEEAIPLYEKFICEIRNLGIKTETGQFGAMMDVEIHNNGPVTMIIDSPK